MHKAWFVLKGLARRSQFGHFRESSENTFFYKELFVSIILHTFESNSVLIVFAVYFQKLHAFVLSLY